MGQIRVDSRKVILFADYLWCCLQHFLYFSKLTQSAPVLAHSVIFNFLEQASLLRAGRSRQQL